MQRKFTPLSPSLSSLLGVACPQMKNNKNVSMLARSAACFGASIFVVTGNNKVDSHISRDAKLEYVHVNSLIPRLEFCKKNGWKIVAIEQSDSAKSIFEYSFANGPTMLVVGSETKGVSDDILKMADDIIEIPRFGGPNSMNVAVAGSIVIAEFAKQRKYIQGVKKLCGSIV